MLIEILPDNVLLKAGKYESVIKQQNSKTETNQ